MACLQVLSRDKKTTSGTKEKKEKVKTKKPKVPSYVRNPGDLSPSDQFFVERPPAPAAPPAPAPSFPSPPVPLSQMDRGQVVAHARAILSFLAPNQVNGEGECPLWEVEVSTSAIPAKIRKSVGLGQGEEAISLAGFRSWNPAMRLGRNFKQGPGADCPLWRRGCGWVPYLRLVIVILTHLHQRDPEADAMGVKAPKPKGPPPKR